MTDSDYVTLSLQLAGEEDLLLGKGSEKQTRFSGIRKVTKLTLLKPVDNLNELKALDTNKYMYALCVGLYDTPDSKNGYFYYFDPYSEENEQIPYVIAPALGDGRWKYIPYALDLIEESINKYVDSELPIIVNKEVIKLVDEIASPILQNKAEEVVTPIVENRLHAEVNLKLPVLVSKEMLELYSRHNKNTVSRTITKDMEGSALVFRSLAQGKFTFKLYKDDQLQSRFDLDMYGKTWARNYLRFSNVWHSRVDLDVQGNKFGYLSYPKFCFFQRYSYAAGESGSFSGIYFESGASELYDKIIIESEETLSDDSIYVDRNPNFEVVGYDQGAGGFEVNQESKLFAVREGGGSEIEGIGCIFPTLRPDMVISDAQKAWFGSYDYYLFRNGFIPWTQAVILPNYYTSYHTRGESVYSFLNKDPSDRYLVNRGATQDVVIGAKKDAELPNITGQFESSTHNNLRRNPTGAFRLRSSDGYGFGGGSNRAITYSYDFKASNSNSVYKDGVNSVQTARIVTKYCVRVY